MSGKALRLYGAAGILPAPPRTPAGYRIYGDETLSLLEFVGRARRLGFSRAEIKEIVAIRRTGRAPCDHVRALDRRRPPSHRGAARDENKEEYEMTNVKVSLCPACDACPSVEIVSDAVRIGEHEKTAVLTKDEWNVLVDLIQAGTLTRI